VSTSTVIRFDQVTVTYPGQHRSVLSDVDLQIQRGELALVVGRTGSGKTTFLRAINGLVPHFTGGHLQGRVIVAGRDTATHPPRELADLVGVVPQDPMSGFVTDTVEDELAYSMESLGLAPSTMRRRVEETLDLLGLTEQRQRALPTLSAGQQQRVAIGAALTAHPAVIVLDEPTSALDPGAAEDVLAALHRLVHDLDITVVMSEHRLERVVQYADRVIVVPGNGEPITVGQPAAVMHSAPIAPPVVHLGRLAGWEPLPLTIRDARRVAGPLRDLLVGHAPSERLDPTLVELDELTALGQVSLSYQQQPALREVSLSVHAGEVVALMGRNGAGKSTLLSLIAGLRKPDRGQVRLADQDPMTMPPRTRIHQVGLVPQEPGDLLTSVTVGEECRAADRDANATPGTTRALLALLAPDLDDGGHPRDLSEGERLLLVLAVILAARPGLLLLDEPTRGLDYPTKARLVQVLGDLAAAGHGIVLATHDVELAAEVATRVVVLADGEIVSDGDAAAVLTASPMFAPQVSKVLAPQPWMTVRQIQDALSRS
jgi:energy-coupling factor transporter ATP-binding protein EcfA2